MNGGRVHSGKRYLVAGSRSWNRTLFETHPTFRGDAWSFVSDDDELEEAIAVAPSPTWIFFLHWSTIVPARIHERYRCVVFHMTDLPFGRGGSPLQHLIALGRKRTVVSALRMTAEVDAGPVYAKRPLWLDGTAEAIYERAGIASAEIIADLVRDSPDPVPQQGEVVRFERRTPQQSVLPIDGGLDIVHDHIRMLDAEGYPHAFLEIGELRLEFTESVRLAGRVVARVEITSTGEAG